MRRCETLLRPVSNWLRVATSLRAGPLGSGMSRLWPTWVSCLSMQSSVVSLLVYYNIIAELSEWIWRWLDEVGRVQRDQNGRHVLLRVIVCRCTSRSETCVSIEVGPTCASWCSHPLDGLSVARGSPDQEGMLEGSSGRLHCSKTNSIKTLILTLSTHNVTAACVSFI